MKKFERLWEKWWRENRSAFTEADEEMMKKAYLENGLQGIFYYRHTKDHANPVKMKSRR